MPADARQAVAGQEYTGRFDVHVYKPGTLSDFALAGDGWTVVSLDAPTAPTAADPGTFTITFRAVPQDADSPIGLSLRYNGRKVSRSYEVGPAMFARAGKKHRSLRIGDGDVSPPAEPAGRSGLQIVGRIVYTRPCRDMSYPADGDCGDPEDMPERLVGADMIDVQIWDSDTIGHETIWSGYTDANGFFDTGVVDWDDGDDDPDLVLYYETDTVIVDVTDATVFESTYEFESDEVTDFTGSYYDFGWHTPEDTGLHPALHIFNSVVRTYHFITNRTVYDPPKVQVEWPHGDTGAWYEPGPVEIHLSAERTWRNDTVSHEYGHHFMENYGNPAQCHGLLQRVLRLRLGRCRTATPRPSTTAAIACGARRRITTPGTKACRTGWRMS